MLNLNFLPLLDRTIIQRFFFLVILLHIIAQELEEAAYFLKDFEVYSPTAKMAVQIWNKMHDLTQYNRLTNIRA